MSNYQRDRLFSDYIFKTIGIPIIYDILGWKPYEIDRNELEELDIYRGIDAVAEDSNNEKITIQYRFRDNFYLKYNDVTLRYKRPNNAHVDRRMSEFFKIEADYFIYGISDGSKFNHLSNQTLVKWVVIDLNHLKAAIDNDVIVITNYFKHKCQWQDGRMYCPINNNKDDSSNFIPFDIQIISNNLADLGIIVQSDGY